MFESGSNPPPAAKARVSDYALVGRVAGGGGTIQRRVGEFMRQLLVSTHAFVRRQGYDTPDAQDLTQGFFELFLAKHYLKDVDREKGRPEGLTSATRGKTSW